MADIIRKNKNNTLRKAIAKEDKGVYKTTTKLTTSICVEGTWANRKLIFKHDGVKDCIPLPAEWGGGGWITDCSGVANCIATSSEVAQEILNFLATNNIVFGGDITFENNDVTFNNSDVNFTNDTTLNYDSTTISNHDWDTINNDNNTINNDGNVINNTDNTINNEDNTVNYNSTTVNSTDSTYNNDGDTFNSSNSTYNHDWDTVNYDNTTIEWGQFTNITLYNPTIIGGTGAEVFWFNEAPIAWWAPGTVLTLTNIPLGDVVLSTVGWLIAIEPTDYTHIANSTQVTLNMDTTWEDILVSYVVSQVTVNTALVNEVITGNSANTTFPLISEPLGDIMVSIKWWVIQIEPTDYIYTAWDDDFEMLIDTTGLDIIVTYLKDTTLQQSKQSDWNETDNTKQSYIKNKPTIPVIPPIPTDVSDLTDVNNLLWGTITPAPVIASTHNATVWEYVLVQNMGNTTINLPPAQEGKQIRIKKFTGEDVFQVTINPNGSELIDGYTAVSMSINRTMYTFTGINGNRYLGD